jgi:hypothetical protein
MTNNTPLPSQPVLSPFDVIKRERPDSSEYWTARDLEPFMGYTNWRNMLIAVERAMASCRVLNLDPSHHFDLTIKKIDLGKGGVREVDDYHLTRIGCYLVAMCCDSRKPQVAAALQYFAFSTGFAERVVASSSVVVQASQSSRPWSERFRGSLRDHVCYVNTHHLGGFTVVSTLIGQILTLEDVLLDHCLPLHRSDRPDGSIGQHWANDRKRRGLTRPNRDAPLWNEDKTFFVKPLVYDNSERGTFEAWFHRVYLPEKLPEYLGNKPEFKPFGLLPPASAADRTCRMLTGKPAQLRPPVRQQLTAAGGFISAGRDLPAVGPQQHQLF